MVEIQWHSLVAQGLKVVAFSSAAASDWGIECAVDSAFSSSPGPAFAPATSRSSRATEHSSTGRDDTRRDEAKTRHHLLGKRCRCEEVTR